jgi:hypothetical protein
MQLNIPGGADNLQALSALRHNHGDNAFRDPAAQVASSNDIDRLVALRESNALGSSNS